MSKRQLTANEISSRIQLIIEKQIGLKCEVNYESANFRDDLGMDSLDLVEFTLLVEKEFNVYIDDPSASELQNASDLIKFVQEFEAKKERTNHSKINK